MNSLDATQITTQIADRMLDAALHGIDWITVLIVIFGGLIAKYRLSSWKWNNALKTLIVSTAAITAYIAVLIWSDTFVKTDAPKFFFGYLTATALYPLIVKPIEKLIVGAMKKDSV